MAKKFLTKIDATAGVTAPFYEVSETGVVDVRKIVWNPIDGTFDMGLLNGVTLQAGQELHFFGKAVGSIGNGKAVMFAGVEGDHLLISQADPAVINTNPEYFIGIATQDFLNNDFGYVTVLGSVRGLNTLSYTLGEVLYFDSTSILLGELTGTRPEAPNAKIEVCAVVRVHGTQGILKVRPHVMPRVSDLQDVHAPLTSMSNDKTLGWSTNRWEARTIPSILGYTPVTNARTITINGTTYDLSADRAWTITTDASARTILRYVATANQTTFTISGGYTPGLTDVYRNGIKLDNETDFTATNGTTIVLTNGASVNDVIEVYRYQTAFLANNALRVITEFVATAGQTTFNVTYNSGLVDVFYNGSKLVSSEYTAGNGTSIVLNFACNVNDTLEVHAYSYAVGAFTGQAQLNGTGFVKANGTTITYDNSTYLTTSAAASTYLTTSAAGTTYLPLSGGTLTGPLNGTSAVFSSTISATSTRFYGLQVYYAEVSVDQYGGFLQAYNATTSKYQPYLIYGGSDTIASSLITVNNSGATFSKDVRSNGIYRDYQGEALIYTNTSNVTEIGSSGAAAGRAIWFYAGNSRRFLVETDGSMGFNYSSLAVRSFMFRALPSRPLAIEVAETGGVHSLYFRPNPSGRHLITSNYLSGGVYLPLSLSGRENDADFVIYNNGNIGINSGSDIGTKLQVNGANYVEMATFASTSSSASDIVANNGGTVQFSAGNARHCSNTGLFVPVTNGIQITKAGIVHVSFSQDITTAGDSGYVSGYITKNGSIISENLIRNTGGQWDGINGITTINVNASDVIGFNFNASDILSFDANTWSNYSFIWTSR